MEKMNGYKKIQKRASTLALLICICRLLGGCSFAKEENAEGKIEGDLAEFMDGIFGMSELDADFMDAYTNYYTKAELTDAEKEYLLGTSDIQFKEAYYAIPSMNATAFHAVLLRLNEDQDPEEVKQQLLDHADPRKWVCVEPEVVRAENVGDVIFFLMSDQKTGDALMESFLSMK